MVSINEPDVDTVNVPDVNASKVYHNGAPTLFPEHD